MMKTKRKEHLFGLKDALGWYESSMKADEGVPSGVSGWCIGCYEEVKATTLISLKRKKSNKSSNDNDDLFNGTRFEPLNKGRL